MEGGGNGKSKLVVKKLKILQTSKRCCSPLTQNEMRDNAGKDVDAEEGQRDDEHVEEAVVSLAHAVTHPRTVMVEAFCKI